MTLTLGKKFRKGLNVCMSYEFNMLHHVGVVAKRLRAAETGTKTAPHEREDNTPSGPAGRGAKTVCTDNYNYSNLMESGVKIINSYINL